MVIPFLVTVEVTRRKRNYLTVSVYLICLLGFMVIPFLVTVEVSRRKRNYLTVSRKCLSYMFINFLMDIFLFLGLSVRLYVY